MNTTTPRAVPAGPLMPALRGPELEADEWEMLLHPPAGGAHRRARAAASRERR